MIATTLAAGLTARQPAPPASERQQRAAVALFLYGQNDPDAVVAPGLHGLGGSPVSITLQWLGPCRFSVAADNRREIIDFTRIADIRHTFVANPAAGLVRSVGHVGKAAAPQLPLAVLTGAEDAVCDAQGCADRRVFALADPGRVEAARAAAAAFRGSCPGTDVSSASAGPAPTKP